MAYSNLKSLLRRAFTASRTQFNFLNAIDIFKRLFRIVSKRQFYEKLSENSSLKLFKGYGTLKANFIFDERNNVVDYECTACLSTTWINRYSTGCDVSSNHSLNRSITKIRYPENSGYLLVFSK
ncbi:hypothetical protein CDIK_2335 [Cucumispora dikerogammari]|nr:hypothetical protein CDIK_2335 [Cucumispora dikerogammari]